MLRNWISSLGNRYKKMDTSSMSSQHGEQQIEKTEEQVDYDNYKSPLLESCLKVMGLTKDEVYIGTQKKNDVVAKANSQRPQSASIRSRNRTPHCVFKEGRDKLTKFLEGFLREFREKYVGKFLDESEN